MDMTDTLTTTGAAQQTMVNERDKRLAAEAKIDDLEAKCDALLARVEALG